MQVPVQITFRNISHSDAIKNHLQEKVDKLQQFYDKMVACHVVIELSSKNQQHGNMHNTRINLSIPGKELISTHNENEDMYISIRDAFDDMTRQLENHVEQLREIKNPQTLLLGKIERLFHSDGFGFIEAVDGREFYFNAHHVSHPTFNKLTIGMQVHFIEGMGDEGPQAHRVKVVE